jgi:hypothetical protein
MSLPSYAKKLGISFGGLCDDAILGTIAFASSRVSRHALGPFQSDLIEEAHFASLMRRPTDTICAKNVLD